MQIQEATMSRGKIIHFLAAGAVEPGNLAPPSTPQPLPLDVVAELRQLLPGWPRRPSSHIRHAGDEGLRSSEVAKYGGWPVFEPHTEVEVPPGTPAWITKELLLQTLNVWQRSYTVRLTVENALEIIGGFGRLTDILKHVA
ncbi:MAG TPA: hypothetical protein VGP72_03800 [Planctomycetota bacterium]|jgi:hypothetical protein